MELKGTPRVEPPSPIVVHVPHSSRTIGARYRDQIILDEQALARELLVMTDAYVDEIVQAVLPKAQMVRFDQSRLVVDPERLRDDAKEPMTKRGMGKIYGLTSEGKPLRRQLMNVERQWLERLYDWHHRSLSSAVGSALKANGFCLLVDAHSFPSKPIPCDVDQSSSRPDICLGTDRFHTPPGLVRAARLECERQSWSIGLNKPYSGTVVPRSYYGRQPCVWSFMLEINRSLYMDEATGAKLPQFGAICARVGELLAEMRRAVGV